MTSMPEMATEWQRFEQLSADALYESLNLILAARPDVVRLNRLGAL